MLTVSFAEISTHCRLTFLWVRRTLNGGHSAAAKWAQYLGTQWWRYRSHIGLNHEAYSLHSSLGCSLSGWNSNFPVSSSSVSDLPKLVPLRQILGWLLPSLLPTCWFCRDSFPGGHSAPSSFKTDLGKVLSSSPILWDCSFFRKRPQFANLFRLFFFLVWTSRSSLPQSVRRAERALRLLFSFHLQSQRYC